MTERATLDVRKANLPNGRLIYDLITANNLDRIRSKCNPLTLRHRQSIVCQKISNETLLGHACELGLRDTVKYLLDECEADISERYTRRQISVSPLRVSIDNQDIAMLLLLISRGATAADKREAISCTEHAVMKRYYSVSSILRNHTNLIEPLDDISELSNILSWTTKMNVNNTNRFLRASARGDIGRMKTLLSDGMNAKVTNFSEDDALCMAILNESNAEYFLLNYRVFSLNGHVRALELCGAKFIAFRSDFEKGLRCWRKSLRIRNEIFGVSGELKNRLQTDLGFEFSYEDQLDILADNDAELYIQSLIVFVRLLSSSSEVLQNAFVSVAHRRVIHKDLLLAIKLLAQLSAFPYEPESGSVCPAQTATEGLEYLFSYHFHSDPSDMGDFLLKFRNLMDFINGVNWKVLFSGQKEFYFFVHLQFLMLVLNKIIAMKNIDHCSNDNVWIRDGVTKILWLHSDPYPTTLLHLAIKEPTAYSVIPFILSCSADANCTNNLKSTPMHAVAQLPADISDLLHRVHLLADAGGHIDAVNKRNVTPFMMLKVAGVIENPLRFLSLQCLAAQTIHKYNIKVPEIYPKILISFIKLHSH